MLAKEFDQRLAPRPAPTAVGGPPPWIAGRQGSDLRLRQPGWLLLPLRMFLAVTFVYAGLQKIANPAYLDAHNRSSVVGQMQSLRHISPIGPLLGLSMHAPTLVGVLIAFGELAVGVGALLGLWTRLAAVGGMLLALTFFLTVSWSTTPYYYGSDIVFLFAWSVIAAFGAGGVLSVDTLLHQRARQLTGLRSTPALVGVEVSRLRQLCARGGACGLRSSGGCDLLSGCPVFPTIEALRPAARAELDRRTLLLRTRTAGIVALAAAASGGLTAALGRLAGGTHKQQGALPGTALPKPATPSPGRASRSKRPPGTAIGATSAVPVGDAARFTESATGDPAWVVHPSAGQFVAFSASCTHAGCAVNFDRSSMAFVCPCHGGTFDAKTGQVTGGPRPSPLPAIPVRVVDGQIRVD
jgi:thiosulfate dehydrogenase [quinone] large subunit